MSSYRSAYRRGYRPGGGYRIGPYGDGLANVVPNPPSANLHIRFSAQNIDGSGNSTLTDGQGVSAMVNLGAAGATYNLVQASAPNQPLFRSTAQAGKINNRSALEGDGTMGLASGAVAQINQPTTVFALVKAKASQSAGIIADGADQMQFALILLQTRLYAGTAAVSGQFVTIGNWQLIVGQFNGASSFARMDGVQSAAINPNTGASGTEFDLMQRSGGTFRLNGFVAEFILYNALLTGPQISDVEAYFISTYGVTPQ